MRSSQGRGPILLHIEGKVLPEKAAKREPTALARPACISGRGVKQEGPRRGQGRPRASAASPDSAGLLEDELCRYEIEGGTLLDAAWSAAHEA